MNEAKNIPSIFGTMVFNEKVMKERLPEKTYAELQETIETGRPLEISVANVVAKAMKDWAIEKGATHFTHWFQPMTGVTAEKHDSFIEPSGNGTVIMDFSGKSLVRGETDASSFPSGGLRATFEARGYTAWDPTSYAFVKDGSLYIPTAFCSYGGEALDKKTPLLRSMEALDKQVLRILKLFGNTEVKKVLTTVGPEQEYFLIDKSVYEKRLDLINCGRTLFGARAPKGQESEDHYYGSIKPRVSAFMKELDEELWKLGIYAKTKHNEVAPAQHELAPVFTSSNVATDHNQLTMDLMKIVANKHGMVCLLNEKPFEKVNGSGKHNNWSMITDTGINLLEPGETPYENAQFLLFLTAVIKGVDEYQDLLRVSAASAGNDHRLGANEAPPAIVSMFLGEELTEILEAIEEGKFYNNKKAINMEIGVSVLPHFPKDKTDRNRTSPFAFTGNKFEFRMLGSSASIGCTNYMLNTIVAEELKEFADILENGKDFKKDLNDLIKATIKNHKRIIYNGNNYSTEWEKEAKRRGLLNLKSTVDALPHMCAEKNVKLFATHKVLTNQEVHSRCEIQLENYSTSIHIEGLTMLDMATKEILPAVIEYQDKIAKTINHKKRIDSDINCETEINLLKDIADNTNKLYKYISELDKALALSEKYTGAYESAKYMREKVFTKMQKVREVADNLELKLGKKYWPFPTYADILYSIKY